MTQDEFEELQAEVGDLEDELGKATDHVRNAVSCETHSDFRQNLLDLKETLQAALKDVEDLWKRAGGKKGAKS